jgi:Skp family chaperone for outer membrane proteins
MANNSYNALKNRFDNQLDAEFEKKASELKTAVKKLKAQVSTLNASHSARE